MPSSLPFSAKRFDWPAASRHPQLSSCSHGFPSGRPLLLRPLLIRRCNSILDHHLGSILAAASCRTFAAIRIIDLGAPVLAALAGSSQVTRRPLVIDYFPYLLNYLQNTKWLGFIRMVCRNLI